MPCPTRTRSSRAPNITGIKGAEAPMINPRIYDAMSLWFELKSVVFNHATRNKDSPQSVAACAVEPYCIPDAIIVDVGF
jgi:hypothetical protein